MEKNIRLSIIRWRWFWRESVDRILTTNDQSILTHKGKISHAQMEDKVREIYLIFDQKRKAQEAEQADEDDLKDLQQLEDDIRRRDD